MSMKLYEYAIIFNGERDADDTKWVRKPELLAFERVLANDADQAGMVAARAIPDSYADELDRISVALRPF